MRAEASSHSAADTSSPFTDAEMFCRECPASTRYSTETRRIRGSGATSSVKNETCLAIEYDTVFWITACARAFSTSSKESKSTVFLPGSRKSTPTPNVYCVCLPNADDVHTSSRASSCFTVVCGMLTRRVCTRLRLCEVSVLRMLPVANSRLSSDSESAPGTMYAAASCARHELAVTDCDRQAFSWSPACALPFFVRYSVRWYWLRSLVSSSRFIISYSRCHVSAERSRTRFVRRD
mmetsp:Transcript_98709/g.159114  ORF Transcript_98709/g.159114 Transcript_98709/m.159114 type:complete len:236 (-) Transcript_98709:287-994(-)